jgi:pimeloyl-ACP methyl ester carboxylesterase
METTMAQEQRREFIKAGAALALAAGIGTSTAATGREMSYKFGGVAVRDGTRLYYYEIGDGQPIVMLPGWSQVASQFKAQVDDLFDRFQMIAVDHRGHGESEKPRHGYRVTRLAQDLHDFLVDKDLKDVILLGHSMGCSVIWAYWDLFGRDRLSKLVLVDQAPVVVAGANFSEQEKAESGALFDAKGLYDTAAGLAGPDGEKATAGLVRNLFFTKAYPADRVDWVLRQNLKFPRREAAKLLIHHCTQDWRDVIPTIDLPTLIVGGHASFFSVQSQQWIQRQIKGSRLELFGADEGGGHFMFMENPNKFNALLRDFAAA